MTDDPYRILGIPRSATDREIAAAYRAKARAVHPDAHPDATPAERALYADAMAQVNAAHDAIKDAAAREAWFRSQRPAPGSGRPGPRPGPGPGARPGGRTPPPPGMPRPPGPGECMLCGWGPTRHFAFERQVGMIFAGQRGTVDANLCRDCALALGRSAQNRTLYTGWWGVFAFFTNMAVVARNAGQLRNAAKLRAPAPVAGVEGRIGRPLPPGNPVPRRAGMWFAALVIGAVAALGIGAASQPPPAPSGGAGGGSGGGATSAGWKVGSCIRGTTLVGPVPCSTRHDGEIIDATTTEFLCPPAYDGTVDRSGTIYCIDTDR